MVKSSVQLVKVVQSVKIILVDKEAQSPKMDLPDQMVVGKKNV